MPTAHEKLCAYAEHLLDNFIRLRERYAMLEPMLFDEDVVKTRGSYGQHHGYQILRNALFLSCAQDIAKLCRDRDERAASISNVMHSLESDDLRGACRKQFSLYVSPTVLDGETDPSILELVRSMETHERTHRGALFDNHWQELLPLWNQLRTDPVLDALRTIRDKVTAHTEILYVGTQYQLVDITKLGIPWKALRNTIESMQSVIELIGQVVRGSSFAWEHLDQHLSQAAHDFWHLSDFRHKASTSSLHT